MMPSFLKWNRRANAFCSVFIFGALFVPSLTSAKIFNPIPAQRALQAGALVDFVDDASQNPHITADHVDGLMEQLKLAGISDVSWSYYADALGGHVVPDTGTFGNINQVYDRLGNPFATAVEAGHEQGLEVFGYFKPYEMGVDVVYPEGSPEAAAYGLYDRAGGKLAWADPYMAKHPELTIQHRSVTLPEPANNNPISTIKLYKSNNVETRINQNNLQIWTSNDNYQYQQKTVNFQFTETTEIAKEDVLDINGNRITKAGDPVRVLTLSGLQLSDPYVLVTTNLTSGTSDFYNTATDMMRTYDSNGAEIDGVYSNGSSIYNSDKANFRTWGLMYDHGYGARQGALDYSNTSGKTGVIAFSRGKAANLGAPCETEPLVQQYWLQQVEAILDSGADGVEFRIENHSTHTDFPEEYGYNQVILNQLTDPTNPTTAEIAKVRGDAYTNFLIAAKQLISSRGKKMRINFELDKLSGATLPNRELAYPDNMEMQWERWIELGLVDEAIFRSYGLSFEQTVANSTTNAIANACEAKGIPVFYNQYVNRTSNLAGNVDTIRGDLRYDGFVFYEVASYINYNADGTCSFKSPTVQNAINYAVSPSAAAPTSPGAEPFTYNATPDDSNVTLPGQSGWWFSGTAATTAQDESVYGSINKDNPGWVSQITYAPGDSGYYYQDLTEQQEKKAVANGWKMTLYGRIWNVTTQVNARDNDRVNENFVNGVEKSLGFGVSTSAGDSCVGMESISYNDGTTKIGWGVAGLFGKEGVAQTSSDIENDDNTLPSSYCKYELSWDPKTNVQTLVVTYEAGEGDAVRESMSFTLRNTPTDSSGIARVYFGTPGGGTYSLPNGGYLYVDSIDFSINPIPGDANNDGKVDGSDVTILAGNWQRGVTGTADATWAMGDFNGDKKVDGSDITILAGNWQAGVTTAAAAVPEPSAIALFFTALDTIAIVYLRIN